VAPWKVHRCCCARLLLLTSPLTQPAQFALLVRGCWLRTAPAARSIGAQRPGRGTNAILSRKILTTYGTGTMMQGSGSCLHSGGPHNASVDTQVLTLLAATLATALERLTGPCR